MTTCDDQEPILRSLTAAALVLFVSKLVFFFLSGQTTYIKADYAVGFADSFYMLSSTILI
jgi:hypothetical protein